MAQGDMIDSRKSIIDRGEEAKDSTNTAAPEEHWMAQEANAMRASWSRAPGQSACS